MHTCFLTGSEHLPFLEGSTCNPRLEKVCVMAVPRDVILLTMEGMVGPGLMAACFVCRYNQKFGWLFGNGWVLQIAYSPREQFFDFFFF